MIKVTIELIFDVDNVEKAVREAGFIVSRGRRAAIDEGRLTKKMIKEVQSDPCLVAVVDTTANTWYFREEKAY